MAWKDELPTPGLKPWHEQMDDAADAWEADVDAKVAGKQDAATLDADVAANVANGSSATGAAVIDHIDALAQPLDSDLTAIAALSTTTFGRSLLELADAAAGRTALEVGRTITGTGVPEGVVAAPVGTKYIDLDKTNGAREWIKDSGSGNTGWIVTIGDTDWVNLTLVNGWTATVARAQRVGSRVYVALNGLNGTAATDDQIWSTPAGWRSNAVASTAMPVAGGFTNQTGTTTAAFYTIFDGRGFRSTLRTSGLRGFFEWGTTDSWPASLTI